MKVFSLLLPISLLYSLFSFSQAPYVGNFLPKGIQNPDIDDYEEAIIASGVNHLQISPAPSRFSTNIDDGYGFLRLRPI